MSQRAAIRRRKTSLVRRRGKEWRLTAKDKKSLIGKRK
jgi:hypothetical protein